MELILLDQSWHPQRNVLLQRTLRQLTDPPIELEYPTTLSLESTCSYGLIKKGCLIAHGHLWPRTFQNPDWKVALAGNIATDPSFQGQGYGTKLMEHLLRKAEELKIKAVILWSEVDPFYEKLGFVPFGKERRMIFDGVKKNAASLNVKKPTKVEEIPPTAMDPSLRPHSWTLERTPETSAKLLGIPNLRLFILRRRDTLERPHLPNLKELGPIEAYGFVGKGLDLQNVLHEWGALHPESLLELLKGIRTLLKTPIMILTPFNLAAPYLDLLQASTDTSLQMECPMALAYPFEPLPHSEPFVWGLDSV